MACCVISGQFYRLEVKGLFAGTCRNRGNAGDKFHYHFTTALNSARKPVFAWRFQRIATETVPS